MSIDLAPPPRPDWEGLLSCMTTNRQPDRVYFLERYIEQSLLPYIAERFDLVGDLSPSDPWYRWKREIRIQRFLGQDVVRGTVPGLEFPTKAASKGAGPDKSVESSAGPIGTWEDFEQYPWPDVAKVDLSYLEWLDRNLPEDMCLTASGCKIFGAMYDLVGMERLSFLLYDEPALVKAVADRLGEIWLAMVSIFVQFDRLKYVFGGDDMGHKTATLVSPQTLRDLVLPWHERFARVVHGAGRLYLLHSCGQVEAIMPDLVERIGIDGKHAFEDAVEPVDKVYARWGRRTAIIGGIDVDFLCRADETSIRRRVRQVLDATMPTGRYCLGTGNSVTDYMPFDNFLVMLDEGRRYAM